MTLPTRDELSNFKTQHLRDEQIAISIGYGPHTECNVCALINRWEKELAANGPS